MAAPGTRPPHLPTHPERSRSAPPARPQVFPRLLWRNSPVFSFSDCSFKVQRSKESTARVVVRRELGIVNSFTIEASLAGANFGRLAGMHLTPKTLRGVGHSFCDTILDYFDTDPTKRQAVVDELRMLYPQGFVTDAGDSDGSDGNPEEDCLEQARIGLDRTPMPDGQPARSRTRLAWLVHAWHGSSMRSRQAV